MIILNTLMGIAAFILLMFIIGETNPPMTDAKRRDLTIAFTGLLAFILFFNIVIV